MRDLERLLQPGTLSNVFRFAKDAALLLVRREGRPAAGAIRATPR